jgi:hypothetical protein
MKTIPWRTVTAGVVMVWSLCAACAGVWAAEKIAPSPETPAKPAEDDARRMPATEVRVYDIRGLLVQTPNFTHVPEFALDAANPIPSGDVTVAPVGLLGNHDGGDLEITREELIQQIASLIQDTVGRQEEWAAYGGDVSSLRELYGSLFIKTTSKNHTAIKALLDQLARVKNRMIEIDASYVAITPQSLAKFRRETAKGSLLLDKAAADRFEAMAMQGEADVSLLTTSHVVCMDGQRINTAIVSDHQFVSGVEPRAPARPENAAADEDIDAAGPEGDDAGPAEDGGAAAPNQAGGKAARTAADPVVLRPLMSVTRGGTAVDIESTILPDNKHIAITVRPQVALSRVERRVPVGLVRARGQDEHKAADRKADDPGGAAIESPWLDTSIVRTTLVLPDGGGVILGASRIGPPETPGLGTREVVFFLRVHVTQ